MQEILKRLELIKTAISIDEDEIIELQVMKLCRLEIDSEVQEMLKRLERFEYGLIENDIACYLAKYSGVVSYVDVEIEGLRFELKKLESRLQPLSEKHQEILNDIERFNAQYQLNLGEVITEILRLKKHISYLKTKAYEETKKTIDETKETIEEFEKILDEMDKEDENYEEIYQTYEKLKEEVDELEDSLEDEEVYEEYEETKQSYDEFRYEYSETKEKFVDVKALNSEDKKALKKLWKKACRLCHPDIVEESLKEQALEIMKKLNEAYNTNNIEGVNEILLNLENGYFELDISSDKIDNKELLQKKIEQYKEQIAILDKEIVELEENEIYKIILDYEDLNEYFEEIRVELEEEKDMLEKEVLEIDDV